MKLKQMLFTFFAVLMSGNVIAGYSLPAEVKIDMQNRSAQGDMYSARTSSNKNAFIGCGIRVSTISETEIFTFGFCQAGLDEMDANITCFSQNPELLDAIKSISDYSFISFSWNENGDCTRIGLSTQSLYLPTPKTQKVK